MMVVIIASAPSDNDDAAPWRGVSFPANQDALAPLARARCIHKNTKEVKWEALLLVCGSSTD